MSRWAPIAFVTALVFFVLAVSHSVYETTSPQWLAWHIALRKSYSIVAFAIVGYTFLRAIERRIGSGTARRFAIVATYVAAYSALIEVAQFLYGSTEGLGWNAFDIFCGAIGGIVAVAIESARRGGRTSG